MLLKPILGLMHGKVNFQLKTFIIKNAEIFYTICKICLKTKS